METAIVLSSILSALFISTSIDEKFSTVDARAWNRAGDIEMKLTPPSSDVYSEDGRQVAEVAMIPVNPGRWDRDHMLEQEMVFRNLPGPTSLYEHPRQIFWRRNNEVENPFGPEVTNYSYGQRNNPVMIRENRRTRISPVNFVNDQGQMFESHSTGVEAVPRQTHYEAMRQRKTSDAFRVNLMGTRKTPARKGRIGNMSNQIVQNVFAGKSAAGIKYDSKKRRVEKSRKSMPHSQYSKSANYLGAITRPMRNNREIAGRIGNVSNNVENYNVTGIGLPGSRTGGVNLRVVRGDRDKGIDQRFPNIVNVDGGRIDSSRGLRNIREQSKKEGTLRSSRPIQKVSSGRIGRTHTGKVFDTINRDQPWYDTSFDRADHRGAIINERAERTSMRQNNFEYTRDKSDRLKQLPHGPQYRRTSGNKWDARFRGVPYGIDYAHAIEKRPF